MLMFFLVISLTVVLFRGVRTDLKRLWLKCEIQGLYTLSYALVKLDRTRRSPESWGTDTTHAMGEAGDKAHFENS